MKLTKKEQTVQDKLMRSKKLRTDNAKQSMKTQPFVYARAENIEDRYSIQDLPEINL